MATLSLQRERRADRRGHGRNGWDRREAAVDPGKTNTAPARDRGLPPLPGGGVPGTLSARVGVRRAALSDRGALSRRLVAQTQTRVLRRPAVQLHGAEA